MNKETARALLEELARAEVSNQKIDSLISNLQGDEKGKLVETLGQLAGRHFDLLIQIRKQFPEFDPEGEGKDLYNELKELHESKYT